MTSDARGRRGCFVAVLLASGVVIIGAMLWVTLLRRIPPDAPLARMYRTEADLRALMTAVETYQKDYGAYPPAGNEGLKRATDHLSKKAGYFPAGPQPDAWGHSFCYVPHTQYSQTGSGAIHQNSGYYSPSTYQIYSIGADGEAGLAESAGIRDNICSWDASRSWRVVYHEYNTAYTKVHKERP